MWMRGALKTRAREILAKSYWKALLVSFVMILIGSDLRSGSVEVRGDMDGGYFRAFMGKPIAIEETSFVAAGIIGMALIAVIVAIIIRIFLGYPLEVGGQKYFIKSTEEEFDINYMAYVFKKDRYMPSIKAMLYRDILIFLWTLLLIIPGIIKSYAYRMTPYILADNPNIGSKRALELSNQMTQGQKMNMFILDLSFIGWYFLGLLAFGIGVIFVKPYENATRAELYLVLKENAFVNGHCNTDELHRVASKIQEPTI